MDGTPMTTSHPDLPASPAASVKSEEGAHPSIADLPIRFAEWIADHNLPFLVASIGLSVMLLWAGSFKMTPQGADGIVPLVTHSPLISWQFKLFGTYLGSDLIGATEWTTALCLLLGYKWPRVGVVGAAMATVMFSITSSMLVTTPGTTVSIHGIRYMDTLGLFLYKDIISIGVSLFLIVHFGRRAAAYRLVRA